VHGHWRKRAGSGSGGKVAGSDSVGGVGGRCKICGCRGRGGLAAFDEEKKSRGILEVSSVRNWSVMGGKGEDGVGGVGGRGEWDRGFG
jgi:hypothetical protein